MGSKKSRGGSGKIIAKREAPAGEAPAKPAAAAPAAEKSRVPERIQEKDAGFGTIKIVAGIIVALIVGVSILSRLYGGDDAGRGDLGQGERCANTPECQSGHLCQAYGAEPERCLKVCDLKNAQSCPTGHQCVSLAKQAGRKGMRLTDVCVPDAKAR